MQRKFKAKLYWYFYYVVSFDDKHVCHERAYGHVSNYKKLSTDKFFVLMRNSNLTLSRHDVDIVYYIDLINSSTILSN